MGMPGTRSGRFTHSARLGLAGLVAAGLAVLAAACGSQVATTSSASQPASTASPAGSGTGAGPALCANPASVTRLVVSRVTALPQNHLHFAFPAGVTVSSPARARAVAEAVCGLPAMPRGPMSCPADLGLGYRLSFAAGSRTFPVVTVSSGGCGGVAWAGSERWTARSPGFWTVLARGMGLANGAALQGTSPATPHTSPFSPGPTPAG